RSCHGRAASAVRRARKKSSAFFHRKRWRRHGRRSNGNGWRRATFAVCSIRIQRRQLDRFGTDGCRGWMAVHYRAPCSSRGVGQQALRTSAFMTDALADALELSRSYTLRVSGKLDERLLRAQFHPLFSPIGWHLGHVAWQKECWALRHLGGQPPMHPENDRLWSSFESTKSDRGNALPDLAHLLQYAEAVFSRTQDLVQRGGVSAMEDRAFGQLVRFLANHERQHAEIIATVRL